MKDWPFQCRFYKKRINRSSPWPRILHGQEIRVDVHQFIAARPTFPRTVGRVFPKMVVVPIPTPKAQIFYGQQQAIIALELHDARPAASNLKGVDFES